MQGFEKDLSLKRHYKTGHTKMSAFSHTIYDGRVGPAPLIYDGEFYD